MYTTLRDLINNKSSVSKEPVNKRSLSSRRPVSLTLCTCEDVSPWITGRLPHLSVPAGLMVMQWSVNSHIPVHPSDPARRKSEWYFSQWGGGCGHGIPDTANAMASSYLRQRSSFFFSHFWNKTFMLACAKKPSQILPDEICITWVTSLGPVLAQTWLRWRKETWRISSMYLFQICKD